MLARIPYVGNKTARTTCSLLSQVCLQSISMAESLQILMALLDALSADLPRQVILPMLTDECASAGPSQNISHVHGCAFSVQ